MSTFSNSFKYGSLAITTVGGEGLVPLDVTPNTSIVARGVRQAVGALTNAQDNVAGARTTYSQSFSYTDNVLSNHLLSKVYVSPSKIELGNILSRKTAQIIVWNSDSTTSVTISKVESTAGEGVGFSNLSIPLTIKPNEEKSLTLVADPMGDPEVNGVITLHTSKGNYDIIVTGTRVVLYSVPPQKRVTERLSWKTQIIKSMDATEQRIRLRENPIYSTKYKALTDPRATQLVESKVYGMGFRAIAFPVWHEAVRYAGTLHSGHTVLRFDTRGSMYKPKDLVLVWADAYTYETVVVKEASATQITLERPLVKTWHNPILCPVSYGLLDGQTAFNKYMTNLADHTVEYTANFNKPVPAENSYPLYDGIPVYNKLLTTHAKTLPTAYKQEVEVIDFKIKTRKQLQKFPYPHVTRQLPMVMRSQREVVEFKKWLAYLGGMQKPFWYNSNWEDFIPMGNTPPSSPGIRIEPVGFTTHYVSSKTRCWLAIQRKSDGSWHYRKVKSSTEGEATDSIGAHELLTLDTALPFTYNRESVSKVSLLTAVRLASDTVEIQWEGTTQATCTLTVVEVTK